MAYELTVTALYPVSPAALFHSAIKFDELRHVMEGIATYSGLPKGSMVEGETYTTTIIFYGLIPVFDYTIIVDKLDKPKRCFETRESNRTVERWDHRLSITPHIFGSRWEDRLIIDSGFTSPLTVRGAAHIYTQRHRRRFALTVESSFDYLAP